MAGMRMGPSDAASASTEPEIPAKNIDVRILTWARPPLSQPTNSRATSTNFSVISQRLSNSPVNTNIGNASNANWFTAVYISVTRISGGMVVPEKNKKMTQASPSANATGMPKISRAPNGMSRYGATISIVLRVLLEAGVALVLEVRRVTAS